MKIATAKPTITDALPKELRSGLIDYCKFNFPNESCGFILKDVPMDGEIKPFVNYAIVNRHEKPQNGFVMDPDAQLEIMRDYGQYILGVYHSHPSGAPWPSQEDHHGVIDGLAANWHYWIVTDGAIFEYEWTLTDNGIPALQS